MERRSSAPEPDGASLRRLVTAPLTAKLAPGVAPMLMSRSIVAGIVPVINEQYRAPDATGSPPGSPALSVLAVIVAPRRSASCDRYNSWVPSARPSGVECVFGRREAERPEGRSYAGQDPPKVERADD